MNKFLALFAIILILGTTVSTKSVGRVKIESAARCGLKYMSCKTQQECSPWLEALSGLEQTYKCNQSSFDEFDKECYNRVVRGNSYNYLTSSTSRTAWKNYNNCYLAVIE